MSERAQLHVTPWKENGWQVTRPGSDQQLVVVDTKEKAITCGRELAKQKALGQIVVLNADGTIDEDCTDDDEPHSILG